MSKSYTPGLKILKNTQISKDRILPLKGKVLVSKNETVGADTIVASTELPGNVQMLNIANALNIDPSQVYECMVVQLDDLVSKDQIIAMTKGLFGFFKSEVKSPIDGKIINVSEVTGQVIVSEKPMLINVDAEINIAWQ